MYKTSERLFHIHVLKENYTSLIKTFFFKLKTQQTMLFKKVSALC